MSRTLIKVRERMRKRLAFAAFALCAPLLLPATVSAMMGPPLALEKQYRQRAEDFKARFTILFDHHGLWTGFGMMKMLRGAGGTGIDLTIATDVYCYNIRSSAISAGWDGTTATALTVTTLSGKWVGNDLSFGGGLPWHDYSMTSGSAAGLGTAYPAGTTLKIINNGAIAGRAGDGGGGGNGGNGSGGGGAYGALWLNFASTIDNTNGFIYGGGGGGGGGATNLGGGAAFAAGGGGGGGQGNPGGSGAGGGTGAGSGSGGDRTGPGGGGGGGHDSFYGVDGGAGGSGGGWAVGGGSGANSFSNSGGGGGNPGVAIVAGVTPTWLGGNNGTQLKGSIL